MDKSLFNNTQTAFAIKTDTELERAYFLFKMIQSEPLVRIGTAVTKFALKAHMPVEHLIRASVFDHFCGGVTEEDCMPVIDKMYQKKFKRGVLVELTENSIIHEPEDLIDILNKYVIGQNSVKRALAVTICNHLRVIKYNSQIKKLDRLKNSNLLIAGPSGSGKTHMINVIANNLNIPSVVIDATELSSAGYVGRDVETILTELYIKSGN
ncbi:MAG: AAA family ATPase, partial [Bacteroidales bacterium]|nr:AAA family ATPase [Bacteroidales bacterium]